MTKFRIILNDQLFSSIATLKNVDKSSDILMFCELMEDATFVKHHQKKLFKIKLKKQSTAWKKVVCKKN